MHLRRPLIPVAVAAALLLGQWLTTAHEPDHALQPGAAHACAVCAYSHGAGTGLAPSITALKLDGALEAPGISPGGHPLAATLRDNPIRGPPALLA